MNTRNGVTDKPNRCMQLYRHIIGYNQKLNTNVYNRRKQLQRKKCLFYVYLSNLKVHHLVKDVSSLASWFKMTGFRNPHVNPNAFQLGL